MIRREDIRATEKDKVTISDSFRVGDLVRGVVISLGDQSNYYLTTAQNELGVVMAESEEGNVMFPVSWREFVDGRTGRREARKVAKPF
jgi:exosome complex component CSL4